MCRSFSSSSLSGRYILSGSSVVSVVSFITGLFIGVIELCFKRTSLVRVGSTGIEGHGFHYAVAVLIGYVVVLGYRVVVIL